jgi:hypothetical protein
MPHRLLAALRRTEREYLMSLISSFYGILIRMYYDLGHHSLPHFHVHHGDEEASVAFDGTILGAALSPQTARRVREWAALHQDELAVNWTRARSGEGLQKVDPLP